MAESIAELQERVRAFCEVRDWDQFHDPKELAIGLVTEAAELLDLFRFKRPEEMRALLADPVRREAVEDELADALFFILRFAQMNAVDLGAAVRRKLQKNEAKYPVELSRGSNRKYTER